MNNMFRIPTCPHCGTVYRYGDVFKIIYRDRFQRKKNAEKTIECYHCQQRFEVRYLSGVMIAAIIWAALSIGTNLLLLSRMTRLDLVVMFIITIAYMAIAILLLPFFVSFKKCEKEKKKR